MAPDMTYLMSNFGISESSSEETVDQNKNYELGKKASLRLKRHTLGICGDETVKTLDELANLMDDKQIKNKNDSYKIIPEICGNYVNYGWGELYFEKTEKDGQEAVKIYKNDGVDKFIQGWDRVYGGG